MYETLFTDNITKPIIDICSNLKNIVYDFDSIKEDLEDYIETVKCDEISFIIDSDRDYINGINTDNINEVRFVLNTSKHTIQKFIKSAEDRCMDLNVQQKLVDLELFSRIAFTRLEKIYKQNKN